MLLSEVNRTTVAKTAILAPGEGNCPGLQDRPLFPAGGHYGTTSS